MISILILMVMSMSIISFLIGIKSDNDFLTQGSIIMMLIGSFVILRAIQW